MRELGGRPHWAKNFTYTTQPQLEEMYGDDMKEFMKIRDEVDPEGMWLGEWHRRCLPIGEGKGERQIHSRRMGKGYGDGLLWTGMVDVGADKGVEEVIAMKEGSDEGEQTPSPPMTSTSDESFDYMAKGEASVYQGGGEKEE